MFGIGPWEWFIVLTLALVVVGPRRLPEVARTVGKLATEVRRTTFDLRRTLENELDEEDREQRITESRARRLAREEQLAEQGETIPRPAVAPSTAPDEGEGEGESESECESESESEGEGEGEGEGESEGESESEGECESEGGQESDDRKGPA